MADVHVRAGGAGIADQADIGLGGAFRVDARHVGDVGKGRDIMRRRQLAHRGQFLDAGARGVGVEDADADAALVQSVGKAVEDAGHLRIAGYIVDPAAIAHGIAERLQRALRVGAGHRADARKSPVGSGAVVQHATLVGLAPIPGCDRQHARLEVERRRHPVECLHAVGRDRLTVRMQVDEAGSYHKAGRVDHPLGAAEPGADSGDLAIHHRHIANRVHPARRIHHPAASDHQGTHVVIPLRKRLLVGQQVRRHVIQRRDRSNRGRFLDRSPPPPMLAYHASPRSITNPHDETQEKWRTSARPPNSPAIESTTEPIT